MAGYQGEIESHRYVEYNQMKLSLISRILYFFIDKIFSSRIVENKKITWFIPAFYNTYKQIKQFGPQLVIVREMGLGNALVCVICRMLGIKNVINYTQQPLHNPSRKNKLYLALIRYVFPHVSFTPVLYKGENRKCQQKNNIWHAPHYFVPLVCESSQMMRSEYCPDGKIRILDIGKYREYKNHFFVVDALSRVKHPERFEVTIIGQLSNKAEQDYHDRLENYIKEKHLENVIKLRGHVGFDEMDTVYANNDVLVLASKEPASISVLESMSRGLCVLGSYENGTTCYLDECKCGISFPISQVDSLIEIFDNISENISLVSEFGQKAQRVATDELCFDKYKEGLNDLLQKEYNYSIPV
ncbi:MAG: glycosyltransferase family 4 protein [Prevotella sp.]|nr:glycosyltransferase family 4 protein [Prevotella sp.]